MSKQTPPISYPNAVSTEYGWADSKTGELLISMKGLKNPIKGYVRNRPFKYQTQKPIIKESPVIDIPTIENNEEIAEEIIKGNGIKKTIKSKMKGLTKENVNQS